MNARERKIRQIENTINLTENMRNLALTHEQIASLYRVNGSGEKDEFRPYSLRQGKKIHSVPALNP